MHAARPLVSAGVLSLFSFDLGLFPLFSIVLLQDKTEGGGVTPTPCGRTSGSAPDLKEMRFKLSGFFKGDLNPVSPTTEVWGGGGTD